jgi:hypothetical protein
VALSDWNDLVIAKTGREVGASYLLARALVEAYVSRDNGISALVIGRDEVAVDGLTEGTIPWYVVKLLGTYPREFRSMGAFEAKNEHGSRYSVVVFDDFEAITEATDLWNEATHMTNCRVAVGEYKAEVARLIQGGVDSRILTK